MTSRRRARRRHPSTGLEVTDAPPKQRSLRARRGVRTAVAAALIIVPAVIATWRLVMHEVTTDVNNVRNNGPDLIAPLDD